MTVKTASLVIIILGAVAAAPHASDRDQVYPPAVPSNLEVPSGHRAFIIAPAAGTQNYVCLPSAAGVAWAFHGPQATLFDGRAEQIMTHYLSPNPAEGGAPRATWQHSRDSSAVWASVLASSTDPSFVAPGAIPWLLLQIVGNEHGPTAGDRLTPTRFIQRVNTAGGVAPLTGCAVAGDIGKRALVPYTTEYVFYR